MLTMFNLQFLALITVNITATVHADSTVQCALTAMLTRAQLISMLIKNINRPTDMGCGLHVAYSLLPHVQAC